MPLLPEVEAFLKACAEELPRDPGSDTVEEMRRITETREARFDVEAPAMGSEFRRRIPVAGGTIDIEIYVPSSLSKRPAGVLIFLHGGGWVLCSLASHANMCRYLCAKAGVIGVNVGYRLAPEHLFPTALDDAAAALDWVAANIDAFGGDPSHIVVAGDSAGGGLAAVLAQRAARGEAPRLAAQALFYPSVGMGVRERFESWRRLGDGGYGVNSDECEWMMGLYLSSGEQRTDPRFSPILAEDLEDAPPTLIITAEYDPLLDEGRAYADRLRAAGGAVEYHCFLGAIHAFMSMAGGMPVGYAALDLAADFITGHANAPAADGAGGRAR